MHPAINGARVAQVAEKMGNPPVTVGDFVAAGTMRATAKGLAMCQSEDFACMLHGALSQMADDHDVSEMNCIIMVFAAAHVCVDNNNVVAGLDEHIHEFVNANKQPLARLVLPAMALRYPQLLRRMGL
jgi:hypothetical protein